MRGRLAPKLLPVARISASLLEHGAERAAAKRTHRRVSSPETGLFRDQRDPYFQALAELVCDLADAQRQLGLEQPPLGSPPPAGCGWRKAEAYLVTAVQQLAERTAKGGPP